MRFRYIDSTVCSSTASSPPAISSLQKAYPVPYFDGIFHPFLRSAYFPGETLGAHTCLLTYNCQLPTDSMNS